MDVARLCLWQMGREGVSYTKTFQDRSGSTVSSRRNEIEKWVKSGLKETNQGSGVHMQNINADQKTISEIAKKVLLEMGQKGVALTPENYQVWFEYCTGSNESLTACILERRKKSG